MQKTLLIAICLLQSCATFMGLCAADESPGPKYDPETLPKGHEYFDLRDGLGNCHLKFEREKTGRIAFLGGSITAMNGWRDHTIRYFEERFPDTKFEFISAGIGSLGSVPHAFRLEALHVGRLKRHP